MTKKRRRDVRQQGKKERSTRLYMRVYVSVIEVRL